MVKREKTEDFEQAKAKFPHMQNYLNSLKSRNINQPKFYSQLDRGMSNIEEPNIIYPVGDPIFIHIFQQGTGDTEYNVIQPELSEIEQKIYDKTLDKLIDIAYREPVPGKITEITPVLLKLLKEAVVINKKQDKIQALLTPKISVTQDQYEKIKYFLIRNRVGYGKLEPLFYDPWLEDIHCTGIGKVTTIHKVFGTVHTNIIFDEDETLDKYMVEVTERVERPTSDAQSIVDAIMPDGSRGNFIYGREISLEGSSFTVRKFSEVPISIIQLINWGTLSAELAAYLWIALEHGMNLFVCGETASGKTTTLNAIAAFIKPDAKVYTVENTPEVTMPHDIWQHLVTREAGKESDITYLDLLIAALRSRPNYIIVGEIRGEEGAIAFQAMQCIKKGNVIIPKKGPVDIKKLYEKNKKDAKQEKNKIKINLEKQKIPVYVSEKDGKIKQSHITNIFKMNKEKLVKIVFNNGEELEVTKEHKFITKEYKEITAKQLLKTQIKPEILIPSKVIWHKNNHSIKEILDKHIIKKPENFNQIWKKLQETNNYSDIRNENEEVFKERTKKIPYKLYQDLCILTKINPKKQFEIIKKGKRKALKTTEKASIEMLKEAVKKIILQKHKQNEYLEEILKINKEEINEDFWKLGEESLKIIFDEIKNKSKTQTQQINDSLWYCLGRLVGDDSLYLTKKKNVYDFRWQIKNKNKDEGYYYAKDAKKIIPNNAKKITIKEEKGIYTTRICNVDRSFIDFLVKERFVEIDENIKTTKAFKKYIPLEKIGNVHAYLAGLIDSDFTIKKRKDGYFEITLALNVNRNHEQLLIDQLKLIKKYENKILPKILCIDFRYHKEFKEHVERYVKICKKLNLNTITKEYNKIRGIGARAEFSTKKDTKILPELKKVSTYMYRKDKRKILEEYCITKEKLITKENKKISYEKYTTKTKRNYVKHLALLSKIFGYELITENNELHNEIYFRITKKNTKEIISVKETKPENTYDISMKEGKYYLGGQNNTSYIYDTGHPVMSTFHAGNVQTMIQRITGHPINVPITFVDNLNLCLIQQAVFRGDKSLRRCLSLTELERYYAPEDKVITREVFTWNTINDEHMFRGMFNSYILEEKISKTLGYNNPRRIYEELDKRAKILQKMVDEKIFDYYKVWDILKKYYAKGEEALPFKI